MTNAEMDAIQVHDAPMRLERTLAPRFKLFGKRLVEATDRTGTRRHSQQRLRDFSHLLRARPSNKHLGESFGNMGFIATVAFKGLGVELTFAISGHFDVLESTSGGDQITCVGAVAI